MYPVSMLTCGVKPEAQVDSTKRAKASISTLPPGRNGRRTADIPSIRRRGSDRGAVGASAGTQSGDTTQPAPGSYSFIREAMVAVLAPRSF